MSGNTYTMPEFADALKRMEKNVRGRTLADAAMAGGRVIEGHAKVNATQIFTDVTGTLANSIDTTLVNSTTDLAEVDIGPSVEYGAIQEFGGFVKPKNSVYLAIPMNAPKGKRPRQYNDLHFVKAKGGDGMLVDKSGVVMFWLTRSVYLPARPYLRPALDENEKEIIGAIGEALRTVIEGSI